MIINILKDISWINELEPYNEQLKRVHERYLSQLPPTSWFRPENYRKNPLSRIYPKLDSVINFRPEYKLIFYLPNYVSLFLIKKLYSDRKDVQIEDVGTGNGNFIYFLAKSGFQAFDTLDIFCECPKSLFEDVMRISNVNCRINDLTVNPVIVNNASAPRFCYITPGLDRNGVITTHDDKTYYKVQRDLSNLELICFYSNLAWERLASEILGPLGYTFLCQDSDHMGVAWCRNDKVGEFREKLSRWEI